MKVDTPASLICGLVASLHLLLAIGAVPVGEELGSDPPCQDYKLDRLLRAVEDKDNRTSFPVAVRYNLLFVVPEQQQQLENQIRLFQFQTCNIMGFEQGQSRNYGGSMGAPIQYWGRVVAGSSCVQATSDGLFILSPCDENRIQQWFRLSSSVDGEVVDYFPFRNQTMSYQYVGQTPYHIGWAQGQVASPLSYSINETFQLLEFPPA
ncbi:hypothetical protein IE53DRAFT_390880 [Violaceomyces palustris]|uniref:Uncharacterized protein n=1 Tax=Violaceomyces palustris TaxID=1673888 RepID=A0ACD0NME5_9BASI|nr:hypothetical protein IE53DRAFT_390880 [Violaceomyces palustris]